MAPKVLIAEDDRAARESLQRALQLEGYDVVTSKDGSEALEEVQSSVPDLVVLDIMMPKIDGVEVCKRIRANGDSVPVLMLTAKGEASDKIAGLDAGADDYMPKPYDLGELFARVRALLRRTTSQEETLEAAGIEMDLEGRKAWIRGRELDLSKTEFDLLELLVRNKGVVLGRETIYDRIWHYDFGPESKNLNVYISYLRSKLEEGEEKRVLHTVRGVGYVIREEA